MPCIVRNVIASRNILEVHSILFSDALHDRLHKEKWNALFSDIYIKIVGISTNSLYVVTFSAKKIKNVSGFYKVSTVIKKYPGLDLIQTLCIFF